MGGDNMPGVWCVLYNSEEEFNLINSYYNKNWTFVKSKNDEGYCNISANNNWVRFDRCVWPAIRERLVQLNAVQISFEDWRAIFLEGKSLNNNTEQKPEDLTYLIEFIKKIEEQCQK